MNVEITLMSIEDIDDVVELENECFSVPWSRNSFVSELTENKLAIYLVARCDKKVVGYAGMWKVFQEGHITNIAVHPDYRRNKVGSCLIEQLIATARLNDIKRMTLEVGETNILAQKLYLKYGFCMAGTRKEYYADKNEDAIIMWLEDI